MRTPRRDPILAPERAQSRTSAAAWRKRAEATARYARECDSKRAAAMVVPLLQLAEATASIEAVAA
jgi:hypothetical protein